MRQRVGNKQPRSARSKGTFEVKGKVFHANNQPFPAGIVRAFGMDLRSEKLLGETTTDGHGHYTVNYIPNSNDINLRLAVYDATDKEIASSHISFNAQDNQTIDLVIDPTKYLAPSEYEKMVKELSPLLESSSLSFAELREDEEHRDASFLSGITGWPAKHIAFLGLAHKLHQETQLEPEIYYGLLRNGLPSLNKILTKGPNVHRSALDQAIKQNIIPVRFSSLLDQIIERLTQVLVKKSMETEESDHPEKTLLHLLDTVIQDKTKQEVFMLHYLKSKDHLSEFWKELKLQPELSALADDIQFTFQAANITKNHLPLVKELQKMRSTGEITSISDLVRFDKKDWKEMITRPIRDSGSDTDAVIGFPFDTPGKDSDEKALNYSTTLARMIEDTYPSKFIAKRLDQKGEDYFDTQRKHNVISFLEANPEFELRYDQLERYLLENKKALDGISDIDGVKADIKTMQRIYKLAPHYDELSVLLKAGLKSAHAIARMGHNSFAAKYGKALGDTAASIIHNRALDVEAKAITLLAEHGISSYKVPLSVLIDEAQSEVEDIPEWSTLFGSIELCSCEQCRSVCSPAAYLVDLLRFLNDRPSSRITVNGSGIENESIKDVLFERRKDIGEIELSCENTNIPLPYVDLVNEILENAVWPFEPFSPFTLAPASEGDLNNQNLSKDLINSFNPPLSTGASITVGTQEANGQPSWVIDDSAFTYIIRKDSSDMKLHVVSRSLQTKGSALERGANPQYINAFSYDKVLSKSVFPWLNLPFSLWGEETRTYLEHIGATRSQIVETFLLGRRERDQLINDRLVAREYLGLSSAEAKIITGETKSQPEAATPGIWNLWGFEEETLSFRNSIPDPSDSTKRIITGQWLDVISQRVDVLLQQSGLEYNELLDLLDTVFINPFVDGTNMRKIRITSSDPNEPDTCEMAKLQLRGFDNNGIAMRIMRFVRLWRKLRSRWSMRDLDRAIESLGKTHPNDQLDDIFDDAFVNQISHIERLCVKFNLPVINVLAFWNPIDTATSYVDHRTSAQPRVPSLYADLFRNRTTSETVNPAFPENPKILSESPKTLSENAIAISNALKISASEFQVLFESSKVIPRNPPEGQDPDDILTLENLSLLYRHSVLAKSLKISILDYISFLDMMFNKTTTGATSGRHPFTSTTETLLFVEKVETIMVSPLSISELQYLLTSVDNLRISSISSTAGITEEDIALILHDIQIGLQKIIADNTLNDQQSDSEEAASTVALDVLMGQKLALLNWDYFLIGDVLATINGTLKYSLPFQATSDLVQKLQKLTDTGISYNKVSLELEYAGIMTTTLRGKLKEVSSEGGYCNAIDALFDSPRNFVKRYLRRFSVPRFHTLLKTLPDGIQFPSTLKNKVYYDANATLLYFVGIMTEIERDRLLSLSVNGEYQEAINTLFNEADSDTINNNDTFMTEDDLKPLFDDEGTSGMRFTYLLKKLLPYLQRSLGEDLVSQKIAENLNLEHRVAKELLTEFVGLKRKGQTDPIKDKSITAFVPTPPDFSANKYVESNPDIQFTRDKFPDQFNTYILLHKIATIITRFHITSKPLFWIFEYGSSAGWLDLNSLPIISGESDGSFDGSVRLLELFKLRDRLPLGEQILDEIFNLARSRGGSDLTDPDPVLDQILERLSENNRWDLADLKILKNEVFSMKFREEFQDERVMSRLWDCFLLINGLKMSAKLCIDLSSDEVTQNVSRSVRQSVRARYDDIGDGSSTDQSTEESKQWFNVAKPLRDLLREKQRTALVDYLMSHLVIPFAVLEWPHPVLKLGDAPRRAVKELKQKLNAANADAPLKIDNEFDQLTHDAIITFQEANNLAPDGVVGPETWVLLDKVRRTMRDTNDLYNHFLIDVEMNPCMVTSRVKQALGSIQLFVQRCLMNLEDSVEVGVRIDERWKDWSWMKNYRVWEANRKVFLYPENWIEPELRDDKSSFFKELESKLLQGEITDELAEEALMGYLGKLDEVSSLEIMGMYHQIDYDSLGNVTIDALHIFGRTLTSPHVYYYRQLIDGARHTAWEQVELDLDGQHLVPVVWNRRLYLFWLVFEEKAKDANQNLVEVKLAWSVRKENKWLTKKLSSISRSYEPGDSWSIKPESFFLKVQIDTDNHLNLILYLRDRDKNYKTKGGFRFSSCNANPDVFDIVPVIIEAAVYETHINYNFFLENATWMSSLWLPASSDMDDLETAFNVTPGRFYIMPPHDGSQFHEHLSFYMENARTFLISPRPNVISAQPEILYGFQTFYHPYVCAFIHELNRNGVAGLLQRDMQNNPENFLPLTTKPLDFAKEFDPTNVVPLPYPVDEIDFDYRHAYAIYNWELFFHIPLLIADRLTKNQQFEESQKWFHRMFNPTDTSGLPIPQRYWQTKPFYLTTKEQYQKQRIQILLKLLAIGSDPVRRAELPPEDLETLEEFEKSIDEWRDNPFKPHLVARMRSTAYQKNVVMKYIDNLIAWGDNLFRRETIESINEATQLYVMAAEILGRRPEDIASRTGQSARTYNDLEPILDKFSNAIIEIEGLISPSLGPHKSISGNTIQPSDAIVPTILYFCVPKNDKLLAYWDTVADRLFKIRHCMNIQGITRQLPLFEPPIDPALLVKAAAAGIDISSVLNDINPALPNYRFNMLSQKASELCSELKSLGGALLSCLEKKDAEQLALIRAEQETSLLKLIELVKEQQIDEAVQNQVSLRKSRDVSIAKYIYYQNLLGVQDPIIPAEGQNIQNLPPFLRADATQQSSIKMTSHERFELDFLKESQSEQEVASNRDFWANIFHLIPNMELSGFFAKVIFGGQFLGNAMQAWANRARTASARHSFRATITSKTGNYIMRAHEWTLQSNLAAREIIQIDKQIVAAEIRKDIAKQELSNHAKQIQNAHEIEDFMKSKYTNQELYSWMMGQVSAIYFQSYQLAYDLAKRAETAYRFELGLQESNFIRFGYWDSLKRGLLVGEQLYHDIKRMELAFLEQNQREYEITKHVSLSRLDPLALAHLKQTGECFVSVPEALFDLDYPGHYLRRIKNASLTVPCVTGPYVGINCTLTLLKSTIRHSNILIGKDNDKKYSRIRDGDDPRFRDSNGAIQSIVTSSGQNDTGLFETNFRDERYLPFEGTGAISDWHIQLPKDFRQFDYDTISDIVLHLRYTAREGGEILRSQAITELQDALNQFLRTEGRNGLAHHVSLRHEFPNEWYNFLNPSKESGAKVTLTMNLGQERWPFLFQDRKVTIDEIDIFVKVRPTFAGNHNKDTLRFTLKEGTEPSDKVLELNVWNGLLRANVTAEGGLAGKLGSWTLMGWNVLDNTEKQIDPNAIEDILIICQYSISLPSQ